MPLTPSTPRLHGLDPAALAGVLSPGGARPVIPGWEILEPLGEGGLGTVWKATRQSDGTIAALKVPRAEDISLVERLEAEAAALRSLDHPHIVRLLETGPLENGSLYLAMEYIDGPPLSQAIPAHGFPAARACEIFRQVAAAVIHAHSRGVLHRDLKPGNILLDASGHARVADFGLAHSVAGRVQRLSLTLAGLIAGTAEYLPPEAYRAGCEPAPTADIYALGVILYELLTGSPPRGAWSPVSLHRKDVDIRIDDLLRRALEPDPDKRFPTVLAMLTELERILRSPARYAGTPRLTRAVRFMDFVWTMLGLFLFLGAFGVIARIEKYGFGLPVDLIGSETIRIGTYQAIFILLVAAAPVCLWQIFRLWRFRAVPLREALPSPLGLKLGTTRTAAVAVALTQLLCVLTPAYFGAQAWREKCMKWLTPDDYPWTEGFVVTEGVHGETAHDPWHWPEGEQTYSLRERSGWITDPLGSNLDHTNFIPGLMPRLVAGLAMLYAATVVLTLLAACISWWRFRKWSQSAALGILTFLSVRAVRADIAAWNVAAVRDANRIDPIRRVFDRHGERIEQIITTLSAGGSPLREHPLCFADQVLLGDTPHDRATLAPALSSWAAPFREPHRRLTKISQGVVPGLILDQCFAWQVYEDCTDPPGGPATGALTITGATAGILYNTNTFAIRRLAIASVPLWSAAPRPLHPGEAAAWVQTFANALTQQPGPGQPDPLDTLFLPHLLTSGPVCQWQPDFRVEPQPRAAVLAPLRALRTRAPRHFSVQTPGPAQHLPGGRRRIALTFGTGDDTARWHADLVFTGGRWQGAQLLTR